MGVPLLPIRYVGSLVPLEGTFAVHSVFASAVNLVGRDDSYPFALLSHSDHRHPRAAVVGVPDFSGWSLRPGQEAWLERGRLTFDVPRIPDMDFSAAAAFDETVPRIDSMSRPDTLARLEEAETLLQTRQTGVDAPLSLTALCSPSSPLERRFAEAIPLLLDRFDQGARLLVGLGNGLTPCGDDFLVGWLAAANALGRVPPRLGDLKNGTNLISASFLDAAERGLFSTALVSLARVLADGQGTARALDVLAGIGHSSGLDAAAGLLTGLRLLSRRHEVHV